jgi:hypothetical protein
MNNSPARMLCTTQGGFFKREDPHKKIKTCAQSGTVQITQLHQENGLHTARLGMW